MKNIKGLGGGFESLRIGTSGIEPPTTALSRRCSTTELRA